MKLLNIIMLVIAAESMVQLWRNAAPLQGVREWLVEHTPFLYSAKQETHLLNCPYCLSVYVGLAIASLYSLMENALVFYLICAMCIHRLSNFMHIIFSLLRDYQINMRLSRRR
jgi:hypothetical protein